MYEQQSTPLHGGACCCGEEGNLQEPLISTFLSTIHCSGSGDRMGGGQNSASSSTRRDRKRLSKRTENNERFGEMKALLKPALISSTSASLEAACVGGGRGLGKYGRNRLNLGSLLGKESDCDECVCCRQSGVSTGAPSVCPRWFEVACSVGTMIVSIQYSTT